jgi:hypothetical protein
MQIYCISFGWTIVVYIVLMVIASYTHSFLGPLVAAPVYTAASLIGLWWILSSVYWLVDGTNCYWVISSNMVGSGDKPLGWPFSYPNKEKSYWGYSGSDLTLFRQQ